MRYKNAAKFFDEPAQIPCSVLFNHISSNATAEFHNTKYT